MGSYDVIAVTQLIVAASSAASRCVREFENVRLDQDCCTKEKEL
jgi:hypothetical protein